MALIGCPECRREVSDRAPSCPHCGCPIARGGPPTPAPGLPVQRSHTHMSHQETGTFGKSFGEETGKRVAKFVLGLLVVAGFVLLIIIGKCAGLK